MLEISNVLRDGKNILQAKSGLPATRSEWWRCTIAPLTVLTTAAGHFAECNMGPFHPGILPFCFASFAIALLGRVQCRVMMMLGSSQVAEYLQQRVVSAPSISSVNTANIHLHHQHQQLEETKTNRNCIPLIGSEIRKVLMEWTICNWLARVVINHCGGTSDVCEIRVHNSFRLWSKL